MTTDWKQLVSDKNSRLSKTIPVEWRIQELPKGDSVFEYPRASGLLSQAELEITSSSATELVEKLSKGELKSVDVTLAFCKRAALAQQLVSLYMRPKPELCLESAYKSQTNCVHEFFPETALAQAKDLDLYYEQHKSPMGGLHGLPISLKDQLRVKVRFCLLQEHDTLQQIYMQHLTVVN
jgi:amidase